MPSALSFRWQPYRCQDNLVFQFILAEFLVVYPSILQLQTQLESKMFAQEQFLKPLEYLGGEAAFSYGKSLSWSFNEGRLAKLNAHCMDLARICKDEEKILLLHRHVDQAFVYCTQALAALRGCEKFTSSASSKTSAEVVCNDSSKTTKKKKASEAASQAIGPSVAQFSKLLKTHQKNKSEKDIFHLITKMFDEMKSFAEALFIVIESFKNDENILFFLLHSAAKLDLLYSPGFTGQLLLSLGEKSLKDMEEQIVKSYRKRGFFHLVPLVHSLFVQLSKAVL